MVSKEVCSWPGESAWPHLTGGADEGGQNVWVQESSCWIWSSPSTHRVGTVEEEKSLLPLGPRRAPQERIIPPEHLYKNR